MIGNEAELLENTKGKSDKVLFRALAWPMSIAAVLRLALMIAAYMSTQTRVMVQGDTQSYLIPGYNLLVHGVFANGRLPEIDRTPGYPIFAELAGMLFNRVLLTVSIQIILSLISIWVVASIANDLFSDRKAASLAALLFACEPLSITATARVMPETLFVLLLLLCLQKLLRFLRDVELDYLLQGGLLLAAATFVRPVSYYLVVPLAIANALCVPRRDGLYWKAPAVLLLSVIPFFAAWQLRNYVETGCRGFSSIVEKNLYFYQSAEIRAELEHISLVEEQKRLGYPDDAAYASAHPEQQSWSRIQKLQFMKSESTGVLKQHPVMYLRSHLSGVVVVAFSPGSAELLQLIGAYPPTDEMPQRLVNEGLVSSTARVLAQHPGVAIVMLVFTAFAILLYVLAAAGLLANRKRTGMWILAGTALYFLLISGGAQAVARYRLPAIPELCILAAGGICALQDKAKRSRQSSSAQLAVLVD